MDKEKKESSCGGARERMPESAKVPSCATNSETLRKCLEENKGDKIKCKSQIDAFKSAGCSPPKYLKPLRMLRGGSLTDV